MSFLRLHSLLQQSGKPFVYIALALASSCVVTMAGAADLATRNLGFEEWQAGPSLPSGWKMLMEAHTVSADCELAKEGKCSVKIESNAKTPKGAMTAIGQTLVASTIGGHPLRLSGWIKTRDVNNGRAELLFQVDGKLKKAVAEAMLAKRGPTGSMDWQRFEIKVPVAANAAFVHFGVGLVGEGTAWFDDIKLEVDESIAVPDIAEIKKPARPQKFMQLLDDQSLALPAGLIPTIQPAWQVGIQKNAHSLRSLFSDDFSDLQFLKPLLKDKRIVQLGESAHGIAEFNWMKTRLIKFLHQEMGFELIAMEASMTAADAAYVNLDKTSALEAMRSSQFGTIGTDETLDLFNYLKQGTAGKPRLILAGFDNQDSGYLGHQNIIARFKSMLQTIDPALAGQVDGIEEKLNALLNKQIPVTAASELPEHYKLIADTLLKNRTTLAKQFPAYMVDMTIQEARSRVSFSQQLASSSMSNESIEKRDQRMAENLNFLADIVYPQKKIIVWAHNFHIANDWADKAHAKTMGVWMAEKRRKEIYTIGLYMGRGVLGSYGKESYTEIAAPPAGSMESILANGRLKMSFVDFSLAKPDASNSWMFAPGYARYWGMTPEAITPAKAYDAVIYIDSVTPSEYPH
ncbi:erythromycin esterase family protein [Undibacterium sp. Tian12W]|uniref:erythromycin esterase family protein n=1 Tax=Undibacterium sp. Tian12W TaxID=3413054 RepID=UPI003BF44853